MAGINMDSDRAKVVNARRDLFVKEVDRIARALDEGPPRTPIGLGGILSVFRELQGVVKSIDPPHGKRAKQAHAKLRKTILRHADTIPHVLQAEFEDGLTRLPAFLESIDENDQYENAELLLIRSSLHELSQLAKELSVDVAVYEERLAQLDGLLRGSAVSLRETGASVPAVWIEAAPEEYWWWRLLQP
jgi:hypothetical protein